MRLTELHPIFAKETKVERPNKPLDAGSEISSSICQEADPASATLVCLGALLWFLLRKLDGECLTTVP